MSFWVFFIQLSNQKHQKAEFMEIVTCASFHVHAPSSQLNIIGGPVIVYVLFYFEFLIVGKASPRVLVFRCTYCYGSMGVFVPV